MLNTVRSKWYELKQVIKFHQNWRGVDFSDMKSLVIFLGNPRSGTTLVRSIISAHPNAVISNELHLVKQLQTGLSWNHAVKKICNNAAAFSKKPVWTDYNYQIKEAAKKEQILIIGDKRSAGTVAEISSDPELVDALLQWSPLPVKIIRCVRNPFDVIATRTRRNELTLEENLDRYFYLEATAEQIAAQLKAPKLHIYNEELINDPQTTIRKLLTFLEIPADEGYINNCQTIIYPSSNKSSYQTLWTPEQLDRVENQVKNLTHLNYYLNDNKLSF